MDEEKIIKSIDIIMKDYEYTLKDLTMVGKFLQNLGYELWPDMWKNLHELGEFIEEMYQITFYVEKKK